MVDRSVMTKGEFMEQVEDGHNYVLNVIDAYLDNRMPYTDKEKVAKALEGIADTVKLEVVVFPSGVTMIDYWVPDYGTRGHGCND